MAFQAHKRQAEDWLAAEGNYSLLDCNENERKLLFKSNVHDGISFYLITPDSENKEWLCLVFIQLVWSDNEEILAHLSTVVDALSSGRHHKISDILNKTVTCLLQFHGAQSSEQDESDEELYDNDDYYEDVSDCDNDDDVDDYDDHTFAASNLSSSDTKYENFTKKGSSLATKRLIADLKQLNSSKESFGVSGSPRGDNLYIWDVQLKDFPKNSPLGKDLQSYAIKCKAEPVIDMELVFPDDYPMSPPFARVIKPRFRFLTGHITVGGSVCMELLTKSGWSPSNDIEGILIQIRTEVLSDPNARLDANPNRQYGEAEAKDSFNRMVRKYGWN